MSIFKKLFGKKNNPVKQPVEVIEENNLEMEVSIGSEQDLKDEDYRYFKKRSELYKEYFDEETKFMRGKLSDGSWRTPFDPVSAQHRVNDYCEGNAWQYLWLVPQDPEGLIELLGGDDAFNEKLDELFSMSSEQEIGASMDITGLIGQYAHGNEPSHHMAYLYNMIGKSSKSQKMVNKILNEMYSAQPSGIVGNEDCGQMSAWYILSSIGIFDLNPGDPYYIINTPLFNEVTLNLENGNKFKIQCNGLEDESNIYIKSVLLNGENLERNYLHIDEILNGGVLKIEKSNQPNNEWSSKNFYKTSIDTANSILTIPRIISPSYTFKDSIEIKIEKKKH